MYAELILLNGWIKIKAIEKCRFIVVGDILKELHLTEGRNTGFGKMLRTLEARGSPKPEFETDENHIYFISRLFVHEAFLKEEESERNQKGAEKEPKKEPKERGIYCRSWKKIQR